MAIEFVCPACGGTLQVGDDSAGRVIRCGACMTALTVPDAGARPAPPYNPYEVDQPAPAARPARRVRDTPPPAEPAEPRRRRDPDDPNDRPRRRRPSEPPPAPGRGVFFWLVIIGAVMVAGVVVCCGGIFAVLPDAQWRKHDSKAGGFRVDLPAKPQARVDQAANINLPDTRSEGAVLLKQGAQFIVFYRDIDPEAKRLKKKEADEQVIEREFDLLLAAMQDREQRAAKPPTGEPSPLGGFDGREFKFAARNGGHYTARVIVADTRVYVLVAGGGWADWDDENVARFLRSFEITNPELVAAGEKRAAAKKDADAKGDGPKKAEAKKADARADEEAAAKAAEAKRAELEAAAKAAEAKKAEAEAARRAELRAWAEAFGSAAVATGLAEAKPAPKPAPPRLPLAPPPRPVVED
jgi:hypothetical protein